MSESAYAQQKRDQRTADEVVDTRGLMCISGCPNRWSIDGGRGRLCSAHAWAPQHQWGQITQGQIEAVAAQSWRAQQQADAEQAPPMSRAQRQAAVAALRALALGQKGDPMAGARRLRDAELHRGGRLENGLLMTRSQREYWRQALAREQAAADVSLGDFVPVAALVAARVVAPALEPRGADDEPFDAMAARCFEEQAA